MSALDNIKINLIEKDTDLSKIKFLPLDWDLVIKGRPYYVVDLPNFVHTIGGKWGANSYWAYPRDEEPSYENLVEFESDYAVEWGLTYNPHHYIRNKYGESMVMNTSRVLIYRNGRIFYDGCYSIDHARHIISNCQDHPLELNSIDYDKKMIGRKVWWRSEPGIITRWVDGQACVIIEPDKDLIDKFTTPAEFADEGDDFYEDNEVKTSIFDKHIWWFRDDD